LNKHEESAGTYLNIKKRITQNREGAKSMFAVLPFACQRLCVRNREILVGKRANLPEKISGNWRLKARDEG
jgi:hypothetical protein